MLARNAPTLLMYKVAVLNLFTIGLECRFEPGERCDWHDASIDGSYRWRSSSETSESGI